MNRADLLAARKEYYLGLDAPQQLIMGTLQTGSFVDELTPSSKRLFNV